MSADETQNKTDQRPSLYLLDAMALIYRAYYALMPARMQTSKGFPTGATYGFLTSILKIIDKYQPDYIAIAFDSKEKTFRHEKFESYKAQRPQPPVDLIQQLEKIHQVVSALGINTLKMPGYEADDIIGTLARKFEDRCNVFVVTPDKDFCQLVHDGVKLLKPSKQADEFELYGREQVKEKYDVYPESFIDVLTLIGDSSDNIPGAAGIGPKTAANLINKYGSIANLYNHLDELKPKTRESLLNDREHLSLARFLVTIKTDMDIPVSLDDLRVKSPDRHALMPLLEELEFRSIAAKFKGIAGTDQPKPKPASEDLDLAFDFGANVDPNYNFSRRASYEGATYTLIKDPEALHDLMEKLGNAKEISFDTETTSLQTLDAELVGISFSVKPKEAFFIYCVGEDLSREEVIKAVKPILENHSIRKVGQNMKYDILVLKNYGIDVAPVSFDTMLASYVLNPDRKHNMDDLASDYLDVQTITYEELVGKGKSEKSILDVAPDELSRYACQDADITLQLKEKLSEKLHEEKTLEKVCEEMEFPLVKVLAGMEFDGIKLDKNVLKGLSGALEKDIHSASKKIFDAAGMEFNLDSPKQLAEVLFEKLKLPAKRRTKTGYSTDVRVLEELAEEFPVANKILEYRSLQKLKTTYVDALPMLVHPKTGRIHTSFNQHIAATGRLSSSNPNLQNIPIRTEIGREIRRAFIASDDEHELLSADYSQIELRIAAELSGDPTMQSAFQNHEDIHTTTARLIFSTKDVTADMRRKAKEVNFGVLYGIQPFGLAQRLDISQSEAKAIIEEYKRKYPKIFEYLNGILEKARASGYVETASGRRRYIQELNNKNFSIRNAAERAAINTPIQGTAADMIKVAMIEIAKRLKTDKMRSKMILQVHDELVFDAHLSEIKELGETVRSCMIDAAKQVGIKKVPIEAEVGHGKNWLEAH